MKYQRLIAFLAGYGLTFFEWQAMARNANPRHWELYNAFCAQERRAASASA